MITKKEYSKKYYAEHKQAKQEYARKYYAENRGRLTEYSRKYWKEHYPFLKNKRKEYQQRYMKEYWLKIRQNILDHYGNRCVCCGETTNEFLCIDHINGGGNQHRKSLKIMSAGSSFYTWIIKNNYPDDLQILCHNCNMAKGFYGICPHQRNKL